MKANMLDTARQGSRGSTIDQPDTPIRRPADVRKNPQLTGHGWGFRHPQARNLVMDLEDAGCRARFLIRDRDGKYPQALEAILADAGIEAVLTGVRMPRMNAVMEGWVAR
ncbi:hypothetical protein ABZ746_25040 [Streptomyces sp. NPDC020096]